ncbi:RHS domain-containing protein [Halocynthiibacter namhaensis]|uniref:RHS domain-containing protein n=1 Tax=Halocynthiibacter namhaensis TaxID=1290553 RepID=UPI0009DE0F22
MFVINDHLGTPKEMVNAAGRMMWAADHDTWGSVRQCRTWRDPEAAMETGFVETSKGDIGVSYGNAALARKTEPDLYLCPIRFQGQWEDKETGLYYNRFGLVPLTFRSLNSFMRPFAQKPRDFSRQAMSGDGAGYRTR